MADGGSSWADEIENESNNLPPPREELKGTTKIVTEYSIKGDKKVRTVRTYKIEKKMVPKAIARRKIWPKFGLSVQDKPGPNPSTTVVSEEIMMQFVQGKEEQDNEEKSEEDKLKASLKGNVKCRICKMDHWTKECPYKDDLGAIRESLAALEKESGMPGEDQEPSLDMGPSSSGKYVPPSRRGMDGSNRPGMGDRMQDRRRDDTAAVRVSNLPEMTTDQDIKDLFGGIGAVARIFLAKDKIEPTKCKGFAFVNYINIHDAEQAIKKLNGFRYQYLVLSVEWAKPSTDR